MSGEAGDQETARDSLLLYNLCCDVGFSPEQWKERIRKSESWSTLFNFTLQQDFAIIQCGSSAEGVAADFLGSDLDILFLVPGTTVTERGHIPARSTDNIFQFVPTVQAAYVRLQLVAIGDTEKNIVREVLNFCETDESGRTVFSGSLLLAYLLGESDTHAQHGPALSARISETEDFDRVYSLHCREWPTAQTEWIHRHRPYNWPSPATIKETVDGGCEVVAVGHPSSRASHLEWRLSSSSAERKLVRSFNICQIQCYFLLKLVLVFLIKPLVPDTLCSYHMKTIMLHVVETTDPADWTQRNLTRCFMKCICVLLRFLEHGNCPQYFIPQHNLFDPKVRGETQRELVCVVKDLQAEGWKCVLRCAPFSNVVAWCHHVEPRCPCFIKYSHTLRYFELLDRSLKMIRCILFSLLQYYQKQSHACVLDAVEGLLSKCRAILGGTTVHYPCQETTTKLVLFVKGTIGYSLLAAAVSRNSHNPQLLDPILQYARQCLQDSCEFDATSCRLKLATFFYQTGQKNQCIEVVRETLQHYTVGTLPVCGDFVRMNHSIEEVYIRRLTCIMLLGGDVNTTCRHVAFPVVFTPWEIVSAPAAVRIVYSSRPLSTDRDRELNNILSIDPVIYACHLLVICYHDLGDPVKSRQALELMGRSVLNHKKHYVFYPEVARLLLEYCVQYTRYHRP